MSWLRSCSAPVIAHRHRPPHHRLPRRCRWRRYPAYPCQARSCPVCRPVWYLRLAWSRFPAACRYWCPFDRRRDGRPDGYRAWRQAWCPAACRAWCLAWCWACPAYVWRCRSCCRRTGWRRGAWRPSDCAWCARLARPDCRLRWNRCRPARSTHLAKCRTACPAMSYPHRQTCRRSCLRLCPLAPLPRRLRRATRPLPSGFEDAWCPPWKRAPSRNGRAGARQPQRRARPRRPRQALATCRQCHGGDALATPDTPVKCTRLPQMYLWMLHSCAPCVRERSGMSRDGDAGTPDA